MLPFIIGAAAGALIMDLYNDSKSKDKTSQKSFDDYWVFARTDSDSKINMVFYTHEDANKMYHKIKVSKKLKYQDAIDNSEFERKHYEQALKKIEEDGITKEEYGLENPDDMLKIVEVKWGKGNDEFSEAEL